MKKYSMLVLLLSCCGGSYLCGAEVDPDVIMAEAQELTKLMHDDDNIGTASGSTNQYETEFKKYLKKVWDTNNLLSSNTKQQDFEFHFTESGTAQKYGASGIIYPLRHCANQVGGDLRAQCPLNNCNYQQQKKTGNFIDHIIQCSTRLKLQASGQSVVASLYQWPDGLEQITEVAGEGYTDNRINTLARFLETDPLATTALVVAYESVVD